MALNPIPERTTKRTLLGDLPDFQKRPLLLMLEIANEHPPLLKLQFGPTPQYAITDPDGAKYILQSNGRNYIKEQQMMNITKDVLKSGQNLFTSDGDAWLKRRRTMQPSFHRKVVADFSTVIVQEANRILNKWQDGRSIDIEEAMMEATMAVIGQTMLSQDLLTAHPQLYDAFTIASEHVIHRATTISGRLTPPFIPTAKNRAYKSALNTIRGVLNSAVQTRQAQSPAERPADLLTMLMAGRDDESGFTFSKEQLMDELYGIVTAGHETSSITLAALFYELAQQPALQVRAIAEVDSVLNGRLPTAEDMPNLPFLNACLDETMRRYPAAYVTTRQSVEADELLGHRLPANSIIMINIYGLHHHQAYWQNPMQFDPDRWSRDEIVKEAFLPFGAGPRKCIGEPLARLEMALIAATLLQRARFKVDEKRPFILQARFTLRAQNGIWLIPKISQNL